MIAQVWLAAGRRGYYYGNVMVMVEVEGMVKLVPVFVRVRLKM